MSITFSESKRIFTIHTQNTTYQMMADRHDRLLHLYYGRRTEGEMDYVLTYADRGFSGNPYDVGTDRCYSLDFLPQEYPTSGTGDYRSSALDVEGDDGRCGCDLLYDCFEILDGKYSLPGLPAVYADAEEDGAQTLKITLKDQAAGVKVDLLYGVLPRIDIITRAAVITNISGEMTGSTGLFSGSDASACGSPRTLYLTRALSANLDFVSGSFDLITFYGRHAMERNLQRQAVPHGEMAIGSRRGMSSHQYNPVMILADRATTETAGFCISMQFVYSGGFTGSAGMDQFFQTRMQMGLSSHLFRYPVKPGDSFTTPEVILSCSNEGFSKLSHNLHDCIRKHVIRGQWRDQLRPLLLNSWEGCYFDFDEKKILDLAREAKELDLDMFVLDDGWFGVRDDDNSGLGDWSVNRSKIGDMGSLISKIHDMGLLFGLWFEPEMVNENSDLFRAHPDWALTVPGQDPVRARNQLVLDFSRKEVVDHIFDQISKIIDLGVDYVKWDYNRSIAEVYTRGGKETGTVLYDYVLGLYDFLQRLCDRYPELLIEGCSGGGGRFDAGMLYYTPQIWCSDNSDAIDRLRIQYGTSFAYPASCMGAHVSVSPNEQNGRVTSLKARTIVAMSGTFGYEFDPGKLSEDEKAQIRSDVKRQKRYAPLIFSGDYYRLTSPFEDQTGSWEFVSKDGSEALVNIVTLETHGNMTPVFVKLQGLDPEASYLLDDAGEGSQPLAEGLKEYGEKKNSWFLNTAGKTGIVCGGGALMQTGLPVPNEFGEYRAYQWHLTKV